MKKLLMAIALVGPYMVHIGQSGDYDVVNSSGVSVYGCNDYESVPHKEICDDMAEALNEAHERRMHPNQVINNTDNDIYLLLPGQSTRAPVFTDPPKNVFNGQ